MANPQKENGYTPLANEILEALARFDFRGCTRNMLDVIIRKTYGFNKRRDKISISQFHEATNKSRRSIIYALQELEAKRLILVIHDGRNMSSYELNKNYKEWLVQNYAPQAEANRIRAKAASAKLRASAKLGEKLVQNSVNDSKSFAPTKDTLTKDNTKDSVSDSTNPTPGQIAKRFFSDEQLQLALVDKIVQSGKYSSKLVLEELPSFVAHWTEPLKSGSKLRWEAEKAFEVGRRMGTWLRIALERKNRFAPRYPQQDGPRSYQARDFTATGSMERVGFQTCGKCDHGFMNGKTCSCVTSKYGA